MFFIVWIFGEICIRDFVVFGKIGIVVIFFVFLYFFFIKLMVLLDNFGIFVMGFLVLNCDFGVFVNVL